MQQTRYFPALPSSFGSLSVFRQRSVPEKALLRLFVALLLMFFTSMVFAQRYTSRSYRKKPRTELSGKSKKGIERILRAEEMAKDGKTAGNGNTLSQAKADTERYRLEQEREMRTALDDPDDGDETPDYMVLAMQAYRFTGDRNVSRFADAVSEFQIQALREQAIAHIDDPEKFNRYMAVISGRQYAPYSSIRDSGYVVNKSTGEISVGNPHTASMHDKKVRADTARKNAGAASLSARAKAQTGRAASGASGTAARQKTTASGMTAAAYREARTRAAGAGRPDLVKELDDMARHMGYLD